VSSFSIPALIFTKTMITHCGMYKLLICRWATVRNHIETVTMLLKRGANVHASNDFSIRNAAKLGLYEICEVLLQNDADPFANENEVVTHAVSQEDDRLLQLFLKYGGVDIKRAVARTRRLDDEIVRLQAMHVEN
jgi:hypothetical protein